MATRWRSVRVSSNPPQSYTDLEKLLEEVPGAVVVFSEKPDGARRRMCFWVGHNLRRVFAHHPDLAKLVGAFNSTKKVFTIMGVEYKDFIFRWRAPKPGETPFVLNYLWHRWRARAYGGTRPPCPRQRSPRLWGLPPPNPEWGPVPKPPPPNPLTTWAEERLVADPEARVLCAEAFADYQAHRTYRPTDNAKSFGYLLRSLLAERGVIVYRIRVGSRTARRWYYTGIRLRMKGEGT